MPMRSIKLYAGKKAVCAFCKNWYDPGNEHINPKQPKYNTWEYDHTAKCKCLVCGYDKFGYNTCPKYECKVNIN